MRTLESLFLVTALLSFCGDSSCRDYRGVTPLARESLVKPGIGFVTLEEHQDAITTTDTDGPFCPQVCTAFTCGNSQCSTDARVRARAFLDVDDLNQSLANPSVATSVPWGIENRSDLQKREFKFLGNDETTIQNAKLYTWEQVFYSANPPDPQYGPTLGFFVPTAEDADTNERAVARQQAFAGSKNIQWGTAGLVGCTMVVLVSNRGVWMAHYFEAYSNGDGVTDEYYDPIPGRIQYGGRGSKDFPAFQQRVLNQMQGIPPPANPYNMKFHWTNAPNPLILETDSTYIGPTDADRDAFPFEAVDQSLFNEANDNTRAYIFTPRDTFPGSKTYNQALYGRRTQYITNLFSSWFPSVEVTQTLYNPDFSFPYPNTDALGCILFQYDADAYGPSEAGWRLFQEGVMAPFRIPNPNP